MAGEGGQEMPGVEPGGVQQAQGVSPIPDEGSEKEKMENQRDVLIERMESEFGLLDKLRKSLTPMQIADVKSKTTTFEKNRSLLELIFENNKHQDLIRALTETHQTHLVNWVRGNGEYRIEFDLDWPLRKKEIDILMDYQESWIDDLDSCGLISLLYSKKVINKRQMDFIKSKQANFEKNEELLNILRRCSLIAYNKTIDCLLATNQPHIAAMLEGNGAIVQAHANLDTDRLDEAETQIVRDLTNLVLQAPENRQSLLLQELQIKVLAVKRGSSIVLYIFCETMKELMYLCEVIDTKELKDKLENLFNTLLHDMTTRVTQLYISETEKNKAKKFFEREASRDKQFDEEISRLCEQIRNDPMQERIPGEASSDDEEEKSFQRGQPSAVVEERMSAIDPMKSLAAKAVASKEAKAPELDPAEVKLQVAEGGDDDDDDDYSDDDEFEDEEEDFTAAEKQKLRMSDEGSAGVATEMGKMQLSDLTRMDIIAAILRNTTEYLMEYMRPEGLIDKLHAVECLTDDDTRYIKTLPIRSEKNDEILNVIDNEKKYNDLISGLRQTRQHLSADIVEKGGVVLKMKVTFKKSSLPDVEKHLVKMICTLHDKSIPKREDVVQFLSQLRKGSIEFLDAQHERGIILWVWVRSENALGKIRSWYKSKNLNKLLLAFFDLLINRQMQLPPAIRTEIEDIQMEYSAWPPKLDRIHQLPVVEEVVCGVTTLPDKIFVLRQNPTEVLVFESQEYSKHSKRIALSEISNPVDIVAGRQAACLYITDATSLSVWKVSTDDGRAVQWLQNIGNPYTLSLTPKGEVVMVRRGQPSTLEVHSPDGKNILNIKLPPKISLPNHAVETSIATFLVSNGKENAKDTGIFEIDKGGNTISYLDFGYANIVYLSDEVNGFLEQLCKDIQLGYPRYLALGKADQLYATDFQNGGVVVLDSQLCLEQVVGREDVKQTLRLCCGNKDNQLVIVHGEKRLLGIYEYSLEIAE